LYGLHGSIKEVARECMQLTFQKMFLWHIENFK
jgi:hypothetical protein